MKITKYLHVNARGDCRVTSTMSRGNHWDEVTFRLNLEIPSVWGKVLGAVDIAIPDPDPASIQVWLEERKREAEQEAQEAEEA